MRSAIPFDIILIPREADEQWTPRETIQERLTQAFPNVEIDPARGKREVLQRMQDALDKGTPEIIVRGMPAIAEQTSYVAIRWPNWPGNFVSGHISGLPRELDSLCFRSETGKIEFLKFAAGQLATALEMKDMLGTPSGESIRTECWPKTLNPAEWIQARYALADSSMGRYDPATNAFILLPRRMPVLQELVDWREILHRGLCRFLHAYRRCNSEAMTHGFPNFEDYATAYIRELDEFASVRRCWTVRLDGQSHHNEVLVDHGEWLTRIDLKGVPSGILD